MHTDETDLIRRLKAGDRLAFDEIYSLYARRLHAFALHVSRSAHDAEDILQDVFVRLWLHRDSIQSVESLKSLLFTMARNRLVNAYKARWNMMSYDAASCPEHDKEDTAGNCASCMEYFELESLIMARIEELPPTQRAVVCMSRFDEMSHQQIADKLGLSVSTVKNALSMGLRTLRNSLAGKVALSAVWLVLADTARDIICLLCSL